MNPLLTTWFAKLYDQGLTQRVDQESMAAEIEETICNQGISILEGGTGIGKSYAALMAALSERLTPADDSDDDDDYDDEDDKISPIVYATGTIALQNQIVYRDLPALCRALGLDDVIFMLVKGRGRYACPRKLWLQSSQQEMLIGDDTIPQGLATIANIMMEKIENRTWDGDLDTFDGHLPPEAISHITVDGNACAGRRCLSYSNCPFFTARKDMRDADILVVNHDLMLSDFALGGGVILPLKPELTDYLIDEAHRIPECAVHHFGGSFHIAGAQQWMDGIGAKQNRVLRDTHGPLPEKTTLCNDDLTAISKEAHTALTHLATAIDSNSEAFSDDTWLFPDGEIPESVLEPFRSTCTAAKDLLKALGRLRDCFADDEMLRLKIGVKSADQHASDFGFFYGRAKNLFDTLTLLLDKRSLGSFDSCTVSTTRWLEVVRDDIKVHAFPTFATDLLQEQVWSKIGSANLFSATLRSLGSFDKFKQESGLEDAETFVHLSPFQYEKSRLFLATGGHNPNSDEHFMDTAGMIVRAHNKQQHGVLVLFTSKRAMLATAENIEISSDVVFADLLIQGVHGSRDRVIKSHARAIKRGKVSIIFGLASFAEGIDLPGKLCELVIIPKLPFSVPSTPMEKARERWIKHQGDNPFMSYSLPNASSKLTQMVGRLIRMESDIGSILILDHRIQTKRYGSLLLRNLPPFTRYSIPHSLPTL